MLAGHIGVRLAIGWHVAEVAEAIDDLLRRAAADPELEATARNEVGGPGILDHVQRVLVAHVDDGRPDLDALGSGADRRQEREWRRELAERNGGPGSRRRRRPGSSTASASSIDWMSASAAERTSE